MKDPRTAKSGTTQRVIADLCESGLTKRETYSQLRNEVLAGRLVFRANVSGRRVPKSESDQLDDLRHNIGRIYNYLGRSKGSKFEDEEIPQDEERNESENEEQEEQSEEEQEEEQDEEEDEEQNEIPQAKGKSSLKSEWETFKRRLHEIRKFCIDRERLSEHVDDISMRPMREAARLIAAGIPADILLLAMAMHWSPDTRRDAGIDNFDFNGVGKYQCHPGMLAVSQRVMKERGISTEGKHALFGYLLLLVENGVPVMLIGPPGTGKSYIGNQLAHYLKYAYGETSMSAGASRSDLLGRHTINRDKPFIPALHTEQFSNGGIHLFDEIDRADPSVMIVLHNALASDVLYNSISGETHSKSETYAPIAAGNTFGLGANRQTTTAERMDSATIDRFRMGRIFLPIDEVMEEHVCDAIFAAALKS